MLLAFVAVLGFNSCSNKGGHGEDNHINDLVGELHTRWIMYV